MGVGHIFHTCEFLTAGVCIRICTVALGKAAQIANSRSHQCTHQTDLWELTQAVKNLKMGTILGTISVMAIQHRLLTGSILSRGHWLEKEGDSVVGCYISQK